jgi:transglutaminase-like putative cysteine protease
MNAPQRYRLALVLVEAFAIAYMHLTYVAPCLLAAVAILGVGLGRQWNPRTRWVVVGGVSILAACFLWWSLNPMGTRAYGMPAPRTTVPALANALLAFQVWRLCLAPRFKNELGIDLGIGLGVMTAAGCVNTTGVLPDTIYRVLAAIFVILVVLALRPRSDSNRTLPSRIRALRQFGIMAIVAAALAVTLPSGYLLFRHQNDIDRMIAQYLRQVSGRAGFSREARIGNLGETKDSLSNKIALVVESTQSPGYLRGAAYDTYDSPRWRSRAPRRAIAPSRPESAPLTQNGERQFDLRAIDSTTSNSAWRSLRIQREQALDGATFTPLDAAVVGLPTDQIELDEYGVVAVPDRDTMDALETYGVAMDANYQEPPPPVASIPRYLELPDNLHPDIATMAREICRDSKSNQEKISAVEDYLRKNYAYALGVRMLLPHDPVEHFLLRSKRGHCELFASAAALLLRHAGVPTRYVSGFVAAERSPEEGTWIARNRDAHAWVEALDETGRWHVVEATPADGVPNHRAPTLGAQLYDTWTAFRGWLRRLFIERDFFGALADGFRWLVALPLRHPVIAALVALPPLIAAARAWWWRRPKHPKEKKSPRPADPAVVALNRLLTQVDNELRRDGLTRADNETLHQFADRLLAAPGDTTLSPDRRTQFAAWYRHYATRRYQSDIRLEDAEALRSSAPLK